MQPTDSTTELQNIQQDGGDSNGPEEARRIDEVNGLPIRLVAAFTSWAAIRRIPAKYWKLEPRGKF